MNYIDIFKKLKFENLTEIQNKIINVKDKNILIISNCGSGKTEASYFKMLENNRKTIIVEPIQTLATGIRDRLNNYNKRLGLQEVTLQHGSISEDRFLKNKYCVTTIDQVLSGYLMLGKQSAIRGKNVLLSNIIFDEVQLFDTESMLLTTINMLDEIYKINNKFIIMTATMPQYLIDFFSKRYDMEVVISENENNKNAKIRYIKELNIENIINYKRKQIIICNTINQARNISNKIPLDRQIILNSRFYKKDRDEIEQNIYKYFGKNSNENDKILITTQIVEVGIDISANRVYTAPCKIDNLVQREGRCCRWGGDGEIIMFEEDYCIYNKKIVEYTINHIINNQNILFTWKLQKQWVSDILNKIYQDSINIHSLKQNKNNFKLGTRSNLIRDIETINLVLCNNDNITPQDFKRESISIYINELKKISESNKLYILHKTIVKEIKISNVEIGDKILINGNNCSYDRTGFHYEDLFINNICSNSPIIDKYNQKYQDYIEETWLHHAKAVESLFKYRLIQEEFNNYIIENIDKISFYGGLHDIGKLDSEWCKKYNSDIPLAHFPFNKKHTKIVHHEYISAEILKDYIQDKIIYNVILQHHRRLYKDNDIEYICDNGYIIEKGINELKKYGLISFSSTYKKHIINKKDIISPNDKEWTTFLYLLGTFMECEIDQIVDYNNLFKL